MRGSAERSTKEAFENRTNAPIAFARHGAGFCDLMSQSRMGGKQTIQGLESKAGMAGKRQNQ